MKSIVLIRNKANDKSYMKDALYIKDICNIIQDYIFQYRDFFRKNFVKNGAIIFAAHSMWLKKCNNIIKKYNNPFIYISINNVYEIEDYFLNFWYLLPNTKNKKNYDDYMQQIMIIELNGQDLINYENEVNENNELYYETQYITHMDAHYGEIKEEERFRSDLDQGIDSRFN
jgi:hypothetical protein